MNGHIIIILYGLEHDAVSGIAVPTRFIKLDDGSSFADRERMRKAEGGFLNEHVLDPRKRDRLFDGDGLGDMGRGVQKVCWLVR